MPGLYSRIAEVVRREKLIDKGDLVIVAVSGGADSLALLHLLFRLKEEGMAFSLYVAHLNHGLRGHAARGDAAFVREEARRLGIPCSVGKADVRDYCQTHRLSLEDGARRLRYDYFLQLARRTGASRVAVGHHRDDQVETMLMNVLRGTGLDGLTGMKYRRYLDEDITLIRPLLEEPREEVESFCRERNIIPRLDHTNLDTGFMRNRVRLQLLPFLENEFNPGVRRALQHLARLLVQDRDLLEQTAEEVLSRLLIKKEDDYCLVLDGKALLSEHPALQGRVLRNAVRNLLGSLPREMGPLHVHKIMGLQREGSPHGVLHLPGGLKVSRSYDNLTFYYREPPQVGQLSPLTLPVPGEIELAGTVSNLQAELFPPGQLKWPPDRRKEAYLDFDRVVLCQEEAEQKKQTSAGKLELLVRSRLPGDRFHPLGAPGRRKLKSFLIDQKIPRDIRERLPLVVAGKEIVWVAGWQISHLCRVTPQTREVLVLTLK